MSTAAHTMSTARTTGSAASQRRAKTKLRLTARGRRVLALLVSAPLAAAIGVSAFAGGAALASAEDVAEATFESVMVLPGDTLWSIAGQIAPSSDPREVIDDIIRLNNLPGGAIQAGSEIAIPAEYSAPSAR